MSDAQSFAQPLETLAEHFRKLPGVGKKSAYRMAFAVLDMPDDKVHAFADALIAAKTGTCRCRICQNITAGDCCPLCADPKRDPHLICVVENPRDVAAIDRAGEFAGMYHVLHGVISPLDGVGPDKLTVTELLTRVSELLEGEDASVEVIVATNPSVEGEATALYLAKLLKPLGAKVSRLAYGIPVGADLEYADSVTLCRAIEGRREM